MASSAENMASFFELMTELGMVEDLASGGEDDLTIFVCQGLPAASYVHNAQSDVSEPDLPAGIESITIGSPVPDRSGHAPQRIKGHSDRRVPRNPSYAAHWLCSLEVVGDAG
jgi:hypothetical protein